MTTDDATEPRIFGEYTRAQLDAQLNLRAAQPDYQIYFDRYQVASAHVAARHDYMTDIAYGSHPQQCFDYFPVNGEPKQTVVFVHGGYWRSLDKADFRFMVEPWLELGHPVALLNYRLAPEVTLDQIVADAAAGIHRVIHMLLSGREEAGGIILMGHSAGAHLAFMAYLSGLVNRDLITGIVGLSGLYDLRPLPWSFLNEDLGLDDHLARALSPALANLSSGVCPSVLAVGDGETDEFIRQTQDFADILPQCSSHLLPGVHHFDIPFRWVEDGALWQAVRSLLA